MQTGTSGPRGASGDTAPGSGGAAKSIPATSRAAGRHHLPASSTAERSSRSHGGDLALFLTALAHHQLLPLGLRQRCCTPGAAERQERGSCTGLHIAARGPRRDRGGKWSSLGRTGPEHTLPRGKWPRTPPDSSQSSKQSLLSTEAEEPPPCLHHPSVHPSISATSILGGTHGSTQPRDAGTSRNSGCHRQTATRRSFLGSL